MSALQTNAGATSAGYPIGQAAKATTLRPSATALDSLNENLGDVGANGERNLARLEAFLERVMGPRPPSPQDPNVKPVCNALMGSIADRVDRIRALNMMISDALDRLETIA